jgi:hypothetical protein
MSGSALAAPLPPGGAVSLSGTTSLQTSWLAGTNTGGTVIIPFTITSGGSPVFQGTFTSSASVSDELGTILVRYRVRDMQAIGNRSVRRVEIAGFGGLQTNVEYSTDGLGDVGPSAASRTASGVRIDFTFDPLLLVSQDSYFFWAWSNGTAFTDAGQARIVLNTGESVILTGVRVPALTDCPSDTNGDGVVNFTDLNGVLSDFGENCP